MVEVARLLGLSHHSTRILPFFLVGNVEIPIPQKGETGTACTDSPLLRRVQYIAAMAQGCLPERLFGRLPA